MKARLTSDLFEAVGVGAVVGLVAVLILRTFGRATGLCG